MEVYQEEENVAEIISLYQGVSLDHVEALIELCQTLCDMITYYKEEKTYRPYLEDMAALLDTMDTEQRLLGETPLAEVVPGWQAFCREYERNDQLIADIMTAEVFADCISDDLESFIESFQSIVMEHIMTRISLFIRKLAGQEGELTAYYALYIRMIGHNIEGMAQYWEENFDDSILEKDYLFLLLQ